MSGDMFRCETHGKPDCEQCSHNPGSRDCDQCSDFQISGFHARTCPNRRVRCPRCPFWVPAVMNLCPACQIAVEEPYVPDVPGYAVAGDFTGYVTKDSGKREQYASGMVRDTEDGKPRFDLMTPLDLPYEEQMLTRWARLLVRGAEKYGDRNWEKARGDEELQRFRASAFRHFMQWFLHADSDEDHAAAVFFNITGAEFVKFHMKGDDA